MLQNIKLVEARGKFSALPSGRPTRKVTHSILAISAKKLDVFELRDSAFQCACNFPIPR